MNQKTESYKKKKSHKYAFTMQFLRQKTITNLHIPININFFIVVINFFHLFCIH